jgi:hypothetical protein
MRQLSACRIAPVASALVLACGPESPAGLGTGEHPRFQKFHKSEWSEPVKLGAPINTEASSDGSPVLSPDGLSLYITSNRAGGLGANDIWVSHRDCETCAWEEPVNLGAPINSSANDGQPTFSSDPHVMIFNSARPGGHGAADIYVTRRADPEDNLGWGAPVNLGPLVNTADNDNGAEYVEREDGHDAVLYFVRGLVMLQRADIYSAPITRDGVVLAAAAPVSELNDPTVNDAGLTVRRDGREIIFWSNRNSPPGTVQGDLFVSTRANVHDPWSPPVNLGPPVNSSEFHEISASLSDDGRTLLITRVPFNNVGGQDIWMSTRTPSGR